MKKFIHRKTQNKDGTKNWTICKGEEIKVDEFTFYYVENVDFGGIKSSCLIEPRSGLSAAMGSTKASCIKTFKGNIEKHGYETFQKMIDKQVEMDGESPSYLKATYNPVKNAQ